MSRGAAGAACGGGGTEHGWCDGFRSAGVRRIGSGQRDSVERHDGIRGDKRGAGRIE